MNLKSLLSFLLCVVVCTVACAVPDLNQLPSSEEVQSFLTSINGVRGASAGVIAFLVVRGLALLGRTPLGQLLGVQRLLVVTILSYVAGVLSLHFVGGIPFISAVFDGSVLPLISVYFDQWLKQYAKVEADKKELAKAAVTSPQ